MQEQRINIQFKAHAHLALWKIYANNSEKGKDIF